MKINRPALETLLGIFACNLISLAAVVVLYDKRARREEDLMSRDPAHIDYTRGVKHRSIPTVY